MLTTSEGQALYSLELMRKMTDVDVAIAHWLF